MISKKRKTVEIHCDGDDKKIIFSGFFFKGIDDYGFERDRLFRYPREYKYTKERFFKLLESCSDFYFRSYDDYDESLMVLKYE